MIIQSFDEFEKVKEFALKKRLETPLRKPKLLPIGKLTFVKTIKKSEAPVDSSAFEKYLSIDIHKSGKRFNNNIYLEIVPYNGTGLIQKSTAEFIVLFDNGISQKYKYNTLHSTEEMCTFLLDSEEKIEFFSSRLIKKIRFYNYGTIDYVVDENTAQQIQSIINCMK